MKKILIVLAMLLILVGCSNPKEKVEEEVIVTTCTINEKIEDTPSKAIITHQNDKIKIHELVMEMYAESKEDADMMMEISTDDLVKMFGSEGMEIKVEKKSDYLVEMRMILDVEKNAEHSSNMLGKGKASEFIKRYEADNYTCK